MMRIAGVIWLRQIVDKIEVKKQAKEGGVSVETLINLWLQEKLSTAV